MRKQNSTVLFVRGVILLGSLTMAMIASAESPQQGLQPVQNRTVIDGIGKRVGMLLGWAGSTAVPTVAFKFRGRLVFLGIEPHKLSGGFLTAEYTNLMFESANCTGTAFVPFGTVNMSLAARNLLDGTKLYAYDFAGPAQNIIVRSSGSTSDPSNPCQSVASSQANGLPLRFLVDLADEFQPPFTLR